MLQVIWTIIKKETTDNLRDRRSVWNSLFGVLINPIFYIIMFGFLNTSISGQVERALELPIQGAANAPNLVDFLDQHNIDILHPPAEIESAVLAGDYEVVLIIPDDFGEKFQNGIPAPIELITDESSSRASIASGRVERLLEQYSRKIGSLRLLARGISPNIITPIQVTEIDVSPSSSGSNSTVLSLLPVIMLTAAFLGGFYLVVDMTAGERERESLEPLLINPVPRWVLLVGKYLTALFYTIFATALATAVYLILLSVPEIQELTAIRLTLAPNVILNSILIMLPVVFMAVALQILISSFTRNVKEAQTYTQLLSLAGFMPALLLAILPIKQQTWMTYIPTIGQLYLVNQISRAEPLAAGEVIAASGVTLLVGAAALITAVWLYRQERIVMGA